MKIVSLVRRGGGELRIGSLDKKSVRGLRIRSWDGSGRLGFVVESGGYLSKHVMDERYITRCDAK
jgi:hypothetical protein